MSYDICERTKKRVLGGPKEYIAFMIGDPETSPVRVPKLEASCMVHLRGKEQDTRGKKSGVWE
jgi:hypothetical protein